MSSKTDIQNIDKKISEKCAENFVDNNCETILEIHVVKFEFIRRFRYRTLREWLKFLGGNY